MTMITRAERQKFQIGYHLNSWDLTGQPIEPALKFLADQGFRWFEILSGASLSTQFSRRVMQLGPKPPLGVVTDTDFLRRMGLLSQAQRQYEIRLSAFYISVEYLNDVAWPYEIGLLARCGALPRTVFLVDRSTDRAAVRAAMREGGSDGQLPPEQVMEATAALRGRDLVDALVRRMPPVGVAARDAMAAHEPAAG